MTPIKRKKISNPNSRMDALRVCAKICRPFECLDNLNILKTLTSLITRRMASDIPFLEGSSLLSLDNSVASVTKYGAMATRSIMFIRSLKNLYLLGQLPKRTETSRLNQQIQIVSIIQKGFFHIALELSPVEFPAVVLERCLAGLRAGIVSRQKETIDSTITDTDMIATHRAAMELSGYL